MTEIKLLLVLIRIYKQIHTRIQTSKPQANQEHDTRETSKPQANQEHDTREQTGNTAYTSNSESTRHPHNSKNNKDGVQSFQTQTHQAPELGEFTTYMYETMFMTLGPPLSKPRCRRHRNLRLPTRPPKILNMILLIKVVLLIDYMIIFVKKHKHN